MNIYETTSPPVQADEVVKAVASLLRDGAGKPDDLEVYVQRDPVGMPEPTWCVVREPVEPGGRFESANRVDVIPIQVKFEIRRPHSPDPDAWLQQAHAWAFGLIVGQVLAVDSGVSATKIHRQWRPSGALYSADDDTYYSSAVYLCPMRPL